MSFAMVAIALNGKCFLVPVVALCARSASITLVRVYWGRHFKKAFRSWVAASFLSLGYAILAASDNLIPNKSYGSSGSRDISTNRFFQ